ncbi:unnamed protein product [Lactuca saligna]|uniref:MADS-box domain-containing protein n=1 Tax=Lactuca saligna TaxID=75948 RepID=A0AA35YQC2_LACSI|nr:unnamed protein product [Lactuca saligna]
MGRRKLEMKRIEDKNSRQVTFSKRRSGLNKKARHLSVLCDIDVAVVVFSSRGKLYEYCSGSTTSVELILSRYQKSILGTEEERSTQERASQDYMEGTNHTCTRFRTCKELLESVRRVDEEGNKVSVSDMTELEEELNAALMHTRSRKVLISVYDIVLAYTIDDGANIEPSCTGKEINRVKGRIEAEGGISSKEEGIFRRWCK